MVLSKFNYIAMWWSLSTVLQPDPERWGRIIKFGHGLQPWHGYTHKCEEKI